MRLTRQLQAVTLRAAVAAAAALAGTAPGPVVAQTAPADAAEARTSDLQQLVATLGDPASEPKAREEAARRLASRSGPEAGKQLLSVLNNAGNPRGQLAVARALAGQASPDPKYIDPLFELIGSDRQLSDAAGQALSAYKTNPAVTNRLLSLAQDNRQHQNARSAALLALASVPEKRVAKVLIDLTQHEASAIRNAAGEALVAMTGKDENGRDGSRWQRWWAGQSPKSDAAFRDELLVNRSARLDDAQARVHQMAEEMRSILTDVYRATPDAEAKNALLIKWMRSTEPQVRLIAAQFIVEAFQDTQAISQPVKTQLRTLVGDSSSAVRLQAVRTIRTLNDTASFNALLAQLSQEPLPEVRAEIAKVLGTFEDPSAVPEVVKLLDDESMLVAEASAEALTRLGPRLSGVEPVAGRELARKLRQVFDERAGAPGAERLREHLVEAIAPLKDSEALRLFMGLLKPRESERVRKAALRGIATLQDPNAADAVRAWLQDEQNPDVRVEALRALGATSKTEHLQTFFDYLTNDRETEMVRKQAWEEFQSLLPFADVQTLSKWSVPFQPYPEKRQIVLKALADKLLKEKNVEQLALTQQNIGETLIRIKASREQSVANAAEAAVYFGQALDHHRQRGSPQTVIVKLVDQYLDALLAARKYEEAAAFAGQMIATDAGLGGKLRVEAERLRDVKEYSDALKLIEAARRIKGLSPMHNDQLKEIEGEINLIVKQNNGKNGSRDDHPRVPVAAS